MLITNILTFLQSEAEKAKVKSTPVIVLYYPVSLKFCFLIVNILYVIPKDSYIYLYLSYDLFCFQVTYVHHSTLNLYFIYLSCILLCVVEGKI